MRLNFSGVGEDDIREGVRRIGKVDRRAGRAVRDAHGRRAGARAAARAAAGAGGGALRSQRPPAAAAGPVSRVALLKGGRSLERNVSLRSAAQVQDALERLGHEVDAIDVGPDLVERLEAAARRRRLRRPPRPRRRGRHRAGAARARRPPLHRLRAGRLHPLHGQGRRQARDARRRASRRPTSTRSRRPRSATSEPPRRSPRSRRGSTSRSSSSRRGQGSALGIKFAASAADVPGALVAAFSYDTKVLLERHVAGRDLAVSVIEGPDGPEALPLVEAIPRERGLLRLRGTLRDRPHRFPVPCGGGRRNHAHGRRSWRSPPTGCSGATASPASTSCSRRRRASSRCSRPTRSPG